MLNKECKTAFLLCSLVPCYFTVASTVSRFWEGKTIIMKGTSELCGLTSQEVLLASGSIGWLKSSSNV